MSIVGRVTLVQGVSVAVCAERKYGNAKKVAQGWHFSEGDLGTAILHLKNTIQYVCFWPVAHY